MKAKLLVQILVLALLASGTTVMGQERVEKKVRREMRKAKKELRKVEKDLKENLDEIRWETGRIRTEDLERIREDAERIREDARENLRIAVKGPRNDRYFYVPETRGIYRPDIRVEVPDIDVGVPKIDIRMPEVYKLKNFYTERGNLLELQKDLDNVSISKDFFFDAGEGTAGIDMKVDGSLEAGELTIKLVQPDGEVYQEFHISPLADVSWNNRLKMDEEGKKYAGKWTVSLSGSEAKGSYLVRINMK